MKHFTADNSLMEILTTAGPQIRLFFPESLLELIPEEYHTVPLKDWADSFMMPWGFPLAYRELLEDANRIQESDKYWRLVPLWVNEDGFTVDTNDLHSVCLMIPTAQPEGVCPAALIIPGGGYENIAFHDEGLRTAERMAAAGYRTFILNYRYKPNVYPAPQMDLALAIRHIRAHAAEYQIDPDNLLILGYSAGGHLCASTAALREEVGKELQKELEEKRPDLAVALRNISVRPDKVCLCYPVISFLAEDHEPSFQALTGGNEALREHLSIEKQVDENYPKTFLWTCEDDSLVPPSNATRMAEALREKKIDSLLKLYPQGEHGCSLAIGTSAEGWMDAMLEFMK